MIVGVFCVVLVIVSVYIGYRIIQQDRLLIYFHPIVKIFLVFVAVVVVVVLRR